METGLCDLAELTGDEAQKLTGQGPLDQFSDIAVVMVEDYGLHLHQGIAKVRRMICHDLRGAMRSGNIDEARLLLATLREFVIEYPEAART
ncbi:MAG: hypothetical protein AAGF79_12930 [Pseudomonadota bacterium]